MSIPKRITVNCSKCGKQLSATVFDSVNSDYAADLAMQIMSGDLFDVTCPHCKFVSHLEYDFLYHDTKHGAMVWVVHKNSPDRSSMIADIRTSQKLPYRTLRIVENMNALKEKVSCLERNRDDRIIELCKVFTAYNLFSQRPDFQFRDAFYTIISGKEMIHLYDNDGNDVSCELPSKAYDYLNDLYYKSAYAKQFDGNYPIVDYAWAEEILMHLMNAESERINSETVTSETPSNENAAVAAAKLICPKCNSDLPEDSDFCQYCGCVINAAGTQIETPKAQPIPPAPVVSTAPPKAKPVEIQNSYFNRASEANHKKEHKPRKKANALSIVLAIALVFSIVANIALCFYHSYHAEDIRAQLDAANATIKDIRAQLFAANATIAEKDTAINSQATTIIQQMTELSNKTTTINQQKAEISNLKKKGNYFDEIVNEMRYGNAGYAAYNFFASDSVIVVSKNDTNRKFTLTANWPNGGTVEVDYSSSAAWVSFDNNEWYTSTKMTVHPESKGVTVVTFSNTVDSNVFKVLIVVTD